MSDTTNDQEDAAVQSQRAGGVPGAGAGAADAYSQPSEDEPTAAPAPGTQNAPAQDMHDTTDEDKIAGVVAQTRADVGNADQDRIADVLRQRFADTGLTVADDRVAALAAEVASR